LVKMVKVAGFGVNLDIFLDLIGDKPFKKF